MKSKIVGIIPIALIIAAFIVKAEDSCIKASHHYDGHPKPNIYVVVVTSVCDEQREVTVKIFDALTNNEIRSEEFPLDPGETRTVSVEYKGEKLFYYAVSNHPPE